MRSIGYCALFTVLALAWAVPVARAQDTNTPAAPAAAEDTNAPAAEDTSKAGSVQASACIQLIQSLIEQVTRLQEGASNQTARMDCITEKLIKIQGLLELTQTAAARLPQLENDDDTDQIENESAKVALACARAEKLALEAENCSAGPGPKPRKHHADAAAAAAAADAAASAQTTTQATAIVLAPSFPVRDDDTCIHQSQMALLLGRAMDIGMDDSQSPEAYTAELGKLAIEPLGGWQPDKCATLDDFCVVVARALNLKIESPDDPASYIQALRDDGLPVDTMLPPRGDINNPPPLLLEPEVCNVFAHGYAAPLPTAHHLDPD
jgi:hypothetical protein